MPPIDHNRRKASPRRSLDEIFNGPDEFGLLDVEAKNVSSGAPLEVSKFDEINVFVDQQGKAPQPDSDTLQEKLLARRLSSYTANKDLVSSLKPYDRHNLLSQPKTEPEPKPEPKPALAATGEDTPAHAQAVPEEDESQVDNATSLEDILASEAFSEFDQNDESLFDPVHVSFEKNREEPDEIAQRRTCQDFYQFEPIFKDLHEKLKKGDVQAARFQQASQVQPGDAFILEGVMCLVDEVGEYQEDNSGRYDPRLRLVFENGTESNHLLQSLAKRLYQEPTGRRIIRDAESVIDGFNNVSHKDKRAGQIYFVTTKSNRPALRDIPNLLKIGYTELTVDERTKNAERDTAFLEAPIRKLASIECYNLNPNKFESLIHGFLHAQRIKITLTGKDGKDYHPREWFSVPLDTAREVVKRIIDGSIVQYRMDNTTGRIVKKRSATTGS